MNVRELIAHLECMDPQAEVRIASQPHYPFENAIDEVVEVSPPRVLTKAEFDEMSEDQQEQAMIDADEDRLVLVDEDHEMAPETIVYIGEGSQIGYLPGNVRRDLGWA